ncbi:glycosyltransferase family 2 protein [Bacteroides cellulosilyticus]|uniref:glycosyltransferase family 2 protein n=1 Tax=Bacteroides cellulosilyticus TaxID=246787 RepID=UPI0022E8A90F|nr:glycosyltransferase family 2 protein [Bacteroides cellulosilyticus]
MSLKVSIITSCYNREITIQSAIESVLSQDYPYIEYIIVDGASKDSSMSIINKYSDRIATVICEPDRGMYEAINKGIRVATGDIIGLLHSDDFFYAKDTISQIVAEYEKTNADLIYGNGLFVDFNNTSLVVRNWISGAYTKSKVRRGWLPLHPTVYIRRECFSKWGLYDESFKIAADSDFLVRYLYETNIKVAYLNEYIVRMRMGGLSTDRKRMKQKWREDLKLYRSHGFNPYWALGLKITSKIPQFIQAKFMNRRD